MIMIYRVMSLELNVRILDEDGIVYPYSKSIKILQRPGLRSNKVLFCTEGHHSTNSVAEMKEITTRSPIRGGIKSTKLWCLKDQTACMCIDLILTILLHNFSSNQILTRVCLAWWSVQLYEDLRSGSGHYCLHQTRIFCTEGNCFANSDKENLHKTN